MSDWNKYTKIIKILPKYGKIIKSMEGNMMEIKQQKKQTEKNLSIINNLWRSLWHTNKKTRNKRKRKANGTGRFLEWSE